MSVTSVHPDVFAKDAGMSLTAIAEEGGNIISISGETTSNITDVTIRVISPNGSNVVGVDQVTPNANGEFSTEFNVSNWKQDGMYKIKANQGTSLLYSITLSVDVTSGMTAETSTTESSLVSNQSNDDLATVSTESTEELAGLSIAANAMEGSDTIEITGQTSKTNEDVTITVTGTAVVDEPNVLSAKRDEVSVAQNSTDNEIAVLLDNGFDIDSFGLDGAIDNGLTFLDGTLTGLSEQGTIIVDTKGTTTPLDDVIVYTPNTGFVGVDHFYYMITDTTGASSIAQVAITVTEIDTPTAADDAIEILEGSVAAVTIDVLDNDSFGSNGAALSNSLEIIPTTTTAVVVNGTSIEYTPTGNERGTDTFTYRIKDAFGKTSEATVTVTFTTVIASDAPKAQDDAVIFAQDSSENIINILDDNGSGADNYGSGAAHPSHPISLVAFYSEKGGSLELDGTTVKYTPRTGYVGEDTFDYLITDENGVSDRATVTINVFVGVFDDDLYDR